MKRRSMSRKERQEAARVAKEHALRLKAEDFWNDLALAKAHALSTGETTVLYFEGERKAKVRRSANGEAALVQWTGTIIPREVVS